MASKWGFSNTVSESAPPDLQPAAAIAPLVPSQTLHHGIASPTSVGMGGDVSGFSSTGYMIPPPYGPSRQLSYPQPSHSSESAQPTPLAPALRTLSLPAKLDTSKLSLEGRALQDHSLISPLLEVFNCNTAYANSGSRAHHACDRCRKRKVKCSEGSPCDQCVRVNAMCIFSSRIGQRRSRLKSRHSPPQPSETPNPSDPQVASPMALVKSNTNMSPSVLVATGVSQLYIGQPSRSQSCTYPPFNANENPYLVESGLRTMSMPTRPCSLVPGPCTLVKSKSHELASIQAHSTVPVMTPRNQSINNASLLNSELASMSMTLIQPSSSACPHHQLASSVVDKDKYSRKHQPYSFVCPTIEDSSTPLALTFPDTKYTCQPRKVAAKPCYCTSHVHNTCKPDIYQGYAVPSLPFDANGMADARLYVSRMPISSDL